jgi:hypothetical protein
MAMADAITVNQRFRPLPALVPASLGDLVAPNDVMGITDVRHCRLMEFR